jgi:hypothetical protein
VPLSLKLTAEHHTILVIPPDRGVWQLHFVTVIPNSHVSIDTPPALRAPED